jgi:hypothetical protein
VAKATAAAEGADDEAQKLLAEAVSHLGMAIAAIAVELQQHTT